ncbi:MAG TPA: Mur ligase family protein [Candidatus Pacearchaeota archaeon]|nr:Mur ligase family protein [Candidatus Pacearchaeota archaeon]
MYFFKKIIYLIKKPNFIFIISDSLLSSNIIFRFLKENNKARKIIDNSFPLFIHKNEKLILNINFNDFKKNRGYKFLLKSDFSPVVLLNYYGKDLFDEEHKKILEKIFNISEVLKKEGILILNYDEKLIKKIKSKTNAFILTYGENEESDFRITDINKENNGINFKINYKGDIIPFWIKGIITEKDLYDILLSIAFLTIKKVNLVEASQFLKEIVFK